MSQSPTASEKSGDPDWKQCKESIEHLPKLRKEFLDFDYFVKKYTGLESGT